MDYSVKKFDDTNKGILFSNSDNWEIRHQGKINIDGEEHRVIGVLRNNKDGQPIIELYRAMGTLKKQDDKSDDNQPDAKGVINSLKNDGAKPISAWKKTSDNGNSYISLALRNFDENKENDII
jgi:uncharacterized protein (DUF736 family)